MTSEVIVTPKNEIKDLTDLARQAISNPLLAGLISLLLNQAAYKAGFYDPRPDPDGQYRTYQAQWGFDANGLHLGDHTWQVSSREEISSQNATIIGEALIAGMLLYAGKAPMLQPIIEVK